VVRPPQVLVGATFVTGAAARVQLPEAGPPEIAFAGRSNAGKSSAINALANRTRLAFPSRPPGPTLDANVTGLRDLVLAARESGLRNIPDPIASIGPPLVRPASGEIDATAPNRSEGARFIVDASQRLSLPYRPLVVVTGGALTDVADAYLLDRTVAERSSWFRRSAS